MPRVVDLRVDRAPFHITVWSWPVYSVLISAFLRAQFVPQLAPIDWSDSVTVGFWIQPKGSAACAAMESYALKEPFAEFLFGHTNKLRGAGNRSTEVRLYRAFNSSAGGHSFGARNFELKVWRPQRRPVDVAHLSSWNCQPAFGLGHPFFAARKSASISAFAFAAVGPVAQTVMRMRPALNTKRRSEAFLPAV